MFYISDVESSWTWAKQVDRLRDERPDEFAPPPEYETYKPRSSKWNQRSQEFAPPSDYYSNSSGDSKRTKTSHTSENEHFGATSSNFYREGRPSQFAPPSDESDIDRTLKFFKNASKS